MITTDTQGLLRTPDDGALPRDWIGIALRSVRLARQAIAEEGREGDVAVAFSIDADIDRADGAETVGLLQRAFAGEPPDLVVVEGLTVVRPTLYATVEALLAIGLPVWLSFRRCRHGLCGVYGQHWGGPEGDAFGRAARRFEELGVSALLLGCIPPDHVDGTLAYLRDFTDLPLGVHPNLGYLTSNGWQLDAGAGSRRVRAHGPALARGGRAADRRLLRGRVRADRRRASGAGRDAAGGCRVAAKGGPTSSAASARRRPSRGSMPAGARCTRSPSRTSSPTGTCSSRRKARS